MGRFLINISGSEQTVSISQLEHNSYGMIYAYIFSSAVWTKLSVNPADDSKARMIPEN